MSKKSSQPKIFAAGGQAVIEGVLMRSKKNMAIAVRRPDGKISVKKQKIDSITERITFLGWPFLRGIINMIEMMGLGFKALSYSANESLGEEEENISTLEMAGTVIVSIALAVGIFKFLPLLAASLLYPLFKEISGSYIIFNIIDGIVKILLFLIYISLIGLLTDVKQLFMYHGAEHMAVHCYEARKTLNTANVKKFPPEHPRCGTSFIIIVLLISIFVYTFIPISLSFWWKLGLRLLLLPVVAGISYELLRASAKYNKNPIMKLVTVPGVLVQKLTTRKPDNKQIEVAIASLKAVLDMEKK